MSHSDSRKAWLNLFDLLIGMVKTILITVCLIMLYPFFGDSFQFKKEQISATSQFDRQPNFENDDWDKVEGGIHLATGLIYADNFDIIRANCTACHSGKLVAQNRATREGWKQMIRWMQQTQGLWDLGTNEPIILDYLAKYYAPKEVGRRQNIDIAAIEWYILDLEKRKK